MPKAMKYRDLVKALRRQGCISRPGKGDHEVWTCADGDHSSSITRTTTVSQGVVVSTVRRLSCLPKGWLS